MAELGRGVAGGDFEREMTMRKFQVFTQQISAGDRFDGAAQDGTPGPKSAGGLFDLSAVRDLPGAVISSVSLSLGDTPADGAGLRWKLYIVDGQTERLWLSGAGVDVHVYGETARMPIVAGRKLKLTSTTGATAELRADVVIETE